MFWIAMVGWQIYYLEVTEQNMFNLKRQPVVYDLFNLLKSQNKLLLRLIQAVSNSVTDLTCD